MNIVKKFKDFFTPKPKGETEQERNNRLQEEIDNRLESAKSEIEFLFTDFEDIGAKVTIGKTYKTERTFQNGSKLHPGGGENPHKLLVKHIGYLKVKIEFGHMKIENISDDFPDEIRRCLIESIFRMNDTENTEVKSADYDSSWSNNTFGSPKRRDIILLKFFNGTPEEYLTQSWAKDYFRVKMWTRKDSDDSRLGTRITSLNNLTINIYTKPIELI